MSPHELPTDAVLGGAWAAELGGVRVLAGPGSLGRLPQAIDGVASRLLLVTDPGLIASGHVDAVERLLGRQGIDVIRFAELRSNPSEAVAEQGARLARDEAVDGYLAVGGGTAMDAAKAINFVATNGGRMRDYQGYGLAGAPLSPSFAVVTTAGTGSDAQSYALISHDETHAKMACGDPTARFRTVVLDPEVASTAPRDVVAVSGIDAVSHAIESFVTRTANPLSRLYAAEAWRLLRGHWPEVLGGDQASLRWTGLLWGAHLAGAAIEQSMLGAAHGCANPLTAHHGVVHGEAVGLMLPHVIRFNHQGAVDYSALQPDGAEALAQTIEQWRHAAGLPGTLRSREISRDSIPSLAADAVRQWTSSHNPRPIDQSEAEALYEAAY